MSRLVPATLVVLAVAVGCTSIGDRVEQPDPARAVVADEEITAWVGPAPTLHPHHATTPGARQLIAALWAPLVVHADGRATWGTGTPQATVAAISSRDLRTWSLTFKAGHRFHDGSPADAAAHVRAWEAAREAGVPQLSGVEAVRTTGPLSLQLRLRRPYGQLPSLLAHPAFLPLPQAALSDPEAFGRAPIGTGPFALTAQTASVLDLIGKDTRIARLRVSTSPEPVRSDIDLSGAGAQLLRRPGLELQYLGLPLTDARFRDRDVRAALSLALDREVLAGLLDGAYPAETIMPAGLPLAAQVGCDDCRFDPRAARAAWQRADFSPPLTLWYSPGGGHDLWVEEVARMWAEHLGITELNLAALPFDDLLDRLREAEISGPFRLGWAADVPSPDRVLEPLFTPRGTANDGRYRAPEVAELVAAATGMPPGPAADRLFAQAGRLVAADLPIIPVLVPAVRVGWSDRVTGVSTDERGLVRWAALSLADDS